MAGQGTKILASDYNVVQSAIATVLGTGSGTLGYGQAVSSSQIVGNPTITASQWSNLRSDLLKAYAHITNYPTVPGSLTIPSDPSLPSPKTKVTATDYANYLALSNYITANAGVTPPSGQASLTSLLSGVQGQRTTAWNGTVTHTMTLTFSSANAARYFFNAGGNVQFSASLTGYPSDAGLAKDQDWAMLLTNMRTITMNSNSTACSGSYDVLTTAVGFYQLTTTPTNIFRKATASPTYTPNQYDIYASVNSNSSPSVITFSIQFQDLSAPGGWGVDENVAGTLSSFVQAYYATGSNVSVSLPSVTSSGP